MLTTRMNCIARNPWRRPGIGVSSSPYGAWAEDHLQHPAEWIRRLAAYLEPAYEEIETRLTSADLRELASEVACEIARMESLCREPERNIPLEKKAFPLTEDWATCLHCPFLELCDHHPSEPVG